MKVLFCNINLNNNFGGPSLLHGSMEILKQINKNTDFLCYSKDYSGNDDLYKEYGIEIKKIPKNIGIRKLLFVILLFKLGLYKKNNELNELLKDIDSSDFVVDLYGIYFCKNIERTDLSNKKTLKYILRRFYLIFIAKLLSVKTIKFPASYGPIEGKSLALQAKIAYKKLFNCMLAREKISREQMEIALKTKTSIKNISDVANLMEYKKIDTIFENKKYITFSVSHQLARQFNDWNEYIKIFSEYIKYIVNQTNYSVIILPNEINPESPHCDYKIGLELYNKLEKDVKIKFIDTTKISNLEVKNIIACSEILVGSRYHSCVAALSSGVPTLVIGWHYKYQELLESYSQNKWIIPLDSLTSENVINLFNKLLIVKEKEREVIIKKREEVNNRIFHVIKSEIERLNV